MATFKPSIKKQRADGLYQVYIRVIHKRKISYIITSKVVSEKGLTKDKEIKDPYVLQYCSSRIAYYIDILNKINTDSWDIKDIVNYLKTGTAEVCFSDYARRYKDNLYNNGQERNSRNYELAYQHLERFAGTTQVMFSHLTSTFINQWIKSLSNTARAKEMYPVCIRQIFKQALLDYNDYDQGIIRITTNPWLKVKIPKADTPRKKAISMEACRAFFTAELPESDRINPLPELGRDVCMMILCLAGINTVDLYNLKKKDYKDGIIGYERAKTRKFRSDNAYIEMRVPHILDPLFEKYKDNSSSEYLFIFHERYTDSDSFNANVNSGIRKICKESLKLDKEDFYSVYTFRHTWGTVAQNDCGATFSEVGFAMNHSDRNRVTKTYVITDFTPAWELNEKVIEKIFFTDEKSHRNQNDQDPTFEKFSKKQMIKGTLYYRGRKITTVEDIGFNNVEEVISALMKNLPETIPSRTMVQIRIENKDKDQKQDYTRMIP